MKKLFYIFILFLAFLNANPGPGSSYHYGYSARSVALSSSVVADKYHVFQSFSNPALLNQSEGTYYGFSYFRLSLDRSLQSYYFSKKLAGNAGLALAMLRAGSGDFIGKDSFNNPTKELSAADYYGLLSFGLGNKKGSGIGLSMKMHYSNLNINQLHENQYSGTSISVDLGGILSIKNYQIGLKIQNIINPYINWDIDRGDGLSNTYSEEYPLIISLGAKIDSKSIFKWGESSLFIQQDFYSLNYYDCDGDDNADIGCNSNSQTAKLVSTYEEQFFKLGYEYFVNDIVALRLGSEDFDKFNLGFGYTFNIKKIYLALDYAVDFGSQNEGISHLITWSFKNIQ